MKYIKFRAWDVEAEKMVGLIDTEDCFVFSKRLLHPDQYLPMMLVARCITGDVYEGDIVVFNVPKGDGPKEPALYRERGIVTHNALGGTAYGAWAAECCRGVKVIGNIHEDKGLHEELRINHGF